MGDIKQIRSCGVLGSFSFLIVFILVASVANSRANALQNNDKTSYTATTIPNNLFKNDTKIQVTLDLRDVKLSEALLKIAKKANVDLSFDREIIPPKNISYNFHKKALYAALQDLLAGTNLTFTLSSDRETIIIQKRLPVIQKETVNGTVTDAQTGQPLIGVNILIVGTSRGTATNADGRYSLSVPSLQDSLRFTYIGYKAQTVAIDGRTEINVQLAPSIVQGQELVVTALGLKQEKQSLSYSSQTVGTESINEAQSINVLKSMQGQVAGIKITQAGSGVGGDTRVVLRGNRSIAGSSQPLYVVDGVPIRGDISDIDPNIIESINVLKGPNAAALYGSQAQNGAIVVTTKKAKKGSMQVSYNSNFMIRQPVILVNFQNVYGQGSSGIYSKTAEMSWGPKMDGQMVDFWSPNPKLAGKKYAFLPQPNNVHDVYQTGYNTANNITASMGGDKIQALFSYTFTRSRGVMPNNKLSRHSLDLRLSSDISDKLHLDSKISFTRQQIFNRMATGTNFRNVNRHAYLLPRNIRVKDIKNYEYTDTQGDILQNYWSPGSNHDANPFWTANNIRNDDRHNEVKAFASLTYDFTDYLSLMVRSAFDGINMKHQNKLFNDTYIIAPNGHYEISRGSGYDWNSDFLLSYDQDLYANWKLKLNLGGNIKQDRNGSFQASTGEPFGAGNGLIVPNFFTLSNTQLVIGSQNVGSPLQVYSFYGFGKLSWKDAIFFSFTGRNDITSTLPPDSRSYFYPSFGLSANLAQLIQDLPDAINAIEVRGSWAKVGNGAPPYKTIRTASLTAGGNNGYLQLSTTLPADNLKPESTTSWEFGLNAQFFNNRFGFDLTYYNTQTKDQLFEVTLPVGSGASNIFINGGNISNKGYELVLNSTPIRKNKFSWNLTMNFSTNKNMVKSLATSQKTLTLSENFLRRFRVDAGEPFGQIYSRGWQRVKDKSSEYYGSVMVNDQGLPKVTAGFDVPVANAAPDWKGSIKSNFNYKNVSFSFIITHRQGGSVVSFTDALLFNAGQTKKTLIGRENGLIFGKDIFKNVNAVVQTGGTSGSPTYSENNKKVSSEAFWSWVGGEDAPIGEAFVENLTNTRVRMISIGYSLPRSIISSLPISGLKLSLVGRNLFFIHRSSRNMDPDLVVGAGKTSAGLSSFAPPTVRTFGFNLHIKF